MAYTAQTLITRSWYLSGITARGLQNVSGEQINDGLYLLNSLIDFKSIATEEIPFWNFYHFVGVPGQQDYFIPNMVAAESLTYTLNTVRYAVNKVSRNNFFATSRANNISSLPFQWFFNRGIGGGTMSVYFSPQQDFDFQVIGKFALTEVTLNTDLETVYDVSYIEYLRYGLAEYMCNEYGIAFSPQSKQILESMKIKLMYIDPPDLSLKKISILGNGTTLNYGIVNLSGGWLPA